MTLSEVKQSYGHSLFVPSALPMVPAGLIEFSGDPGNWIMRMKSCTSKFIPNGQGDGYADANHLIKIHIFISNGKFICLCFGDVV